MLFAVLTEACRSVILDWARSVFFRLSVSELERARERARENATMACMYNTYPLWHWHHAKLQWWNRCGRLFVCLHHSKCIMHGCELANWNSHGETQEISSPKNFPCILIFTTWKMHVSNFFMLFCTKQTMSAQWFELFIWRKQKYYRKISKKSFFNVDVWWKTLNIMENKAIFF